MPPIPATEVEWNGRVYPSLHAAARDTGRQPSSMKYLLDQGYKCEADLRQPRTGMWWNGVYYKTVADAARAVDEPYETMRYRRIHNITSEDMLYGR